MRVPESRFVVRYFPPAAEERQRLPLRLGVFTTGEEADAIGRRFLAPGPPFEWAGQGAREAWGWHDGEDDGPQEERALVLVVEYEEEGRALGPDVRFEPERWLAELTLERALALAAAEAEALPEETEAAREWLEAYRRGEAVT